MDGDVLAALEFSAIVERVAAATATELGHELALGLAPSDDAATVAQRQALTAEAVALIEGSAEPPLDGIADVREAALLAGRGASLDPARLAAVAGAIRTGLRARAALDGAGEVAPLLAELADAVDPGLASLADEVERAVEPDGSDLRDGASPALRRLRREFQAGRRRALEELRRLAGSAALREHLQDDFVTERGGRPVLALKASAPRSLRGVVHDVSASGQTLFVEPFELVEANNRRSEAAAAERDEVERILGALSASVGTRAEAVVALVDAAAAVDLALACGAVSRAWRGAPVEVSGDVRLLGARHPLLDPSLAVPIDLDLGALRALVISGPNTGGKTVALKTLGLAALLHQAGLRPPAAAAALPIFDRVLAEIGDRQSIEMSLSTFSAHVSSLVAILRTATGRSLVLVDELASGTDPAEGSALAQAVLAELARRARLTVVTTHHPELKEWASGTDGAANAATGVDPVTHEPLYRIALGRPGSSHAIETAERLGLEPAVVADARGRVAPERLRVADLLAEAEAAERAAEDERAAAVAERRDAQRLAAEAQARSDELEAEVREVRESAARARERAVAEVERELAAARAELRALRDEIRAARRREQDVRRGAAADGAERDRDRHLAAASTRGARAERALRALEEPLPLLAPLAVGDPVEVAALGVRGTIAAIDGDEAEVVGVSGQRVRVALARLRPARERAAPEAEAPAVRVVASARGDVSDEVDLRGLRAQEARESVRAFVDEAALAGLRQVRMIHGRGTGAVRDAVRDELDRHPLVERRESESADGATVAHLTGG